jgi:hypothetical protein
VKRTDFLLSWRKSCSTEDIFTGADASTTGYSIDDVIDQLASAFSDASKVVLGRSTVLAAPHSRTDRYGKTVRDEVVFECTARHPHPELYSVVPRGDGKNHLKTKKATR